MSDTQLFEEGKDHRLDQKEYMNTCASYKDACDQWQTHIINFVDDYNGARVIVSKDRKQGLIHVRSRTPINFNGQIMVQQGEPESYLVRREWCRAIN